MLATRCFLLSLLSLAVCGCQSQSIVGVWEAQDSGAGSYLFGHYAYLENGDKCTLLFDAGPFGTETLAYLNQWEIDDDVLTITYGPNTNPRFPEGHVSRSRIEEFGRHRMVYRIFEPTYPGDTTETAIRLPDVDPERVCEVVRVVLQFTPRSN